MRKFKGQLVFLIFLFGSVFSIPPIFGQDDNCEDARELYDKMGEVLTKMTEARNELDKAYATGNFKGITDAIDKFNEANDRMRELNQKMQECWEGFTEKERKSLNIVTAIITGQADGFNERVGEVFNDPLGGLEKTLVLLVIILLITIIFMLWYLWWKALGPFRHP